MPRLSLSVLGALDIKRDAAYLTGLTSKTQALIAYLALEAHHPHRREALAGLFWGEQDDAAARNSLRQSLHQLQHALGAATPPWLLITPQTIQFNPACDHALDVAEFTNLSDECARHAHRCLETCRACHVRLQQAAALYRGPLLADLSLKNSDAFEEWLHVKRESLAQRAFSILSVLADYHARHGAYAQMEQAARQQLEIDPFSEEAHRRVMRACAWSGRRNLALAQYETCRRWLQTELGVEPLDETIALYNSLRAGNFAANYAPAQAPLPLPLTSFVGRSSDTLHVQRLLETARLLTLTGPGGCGKTRLALQVVASLAEEYPDGAWFVDLAPQTDPALLPALVASVLGVREQAGRTPLETVTDYLRHKQLILILDNCEHLLEACARLAADVLRRAPRVQLLVTSRAPIGLAGEQVFDVLPLPVPDGRASLSADALAQVEAARLFVERATAVNSHFELTDANAPLVAHLCRQLDGLPLALELGAARTRTLPIAELVQRLDECFRLLTGGDRAAPPRQQTLRATLDWSYDLLTAPDQLLFKRLAVFAGGWTLNAAEAICSDAQLPAADVLDGLTRLIDQSLVVLEVGPQSGAPHYRLLATLRRYAQDRLQSSGEAAQWHARHFNFFLALAEEVEQQRLMTERSPWLARLNAEQDNLRTAVRWIGECDDHEGQLRLLVALIEFWRARGDFSEGRAQLERVIAAGGGTAPQRAKALGGAGLFAWMQSDFVAAADHLAASIRLWRDLGNAWELAYPLIVLGWVNYQTGNYDAGHGLVEESVALSRATINQRVLGLALTYLGAAALDRGDYPAANQHFAEALPVLRQSGDRWDLAAALTWLGHGLCMQGDFQQATLLGEEALELYQTVGERWGIAWVLQNLGSAACAHANYERATQRFKASLTVWQELATPAGILHVLAGLARVKLAQGYVIDAAWLFVAVEAQLTAIGAALFPLDHREYERNVAELQARLDPTTLAAAREAGRALSLEQAIALALQP
ncbi:MAG: tetratricopeptide repeat protein [Thermoflexales bacterium]|nr:tetratricopeptide repeat protein [Thermoflexales bacterium]